MAVPTSFTVRRIMDLHRALHSLDAVKVGKDEIVPLEFSGGTRARIMTNAVAFEPVVRAHEATDRALAKQHGVFQGQGETPEAAAKLDAYRRDVEDALNEEREVAIERIKLSALLNRPGDGKTVRGNLVPQSVLNRLAPILDFEVNGE